MSQRGAPPISFHLRRQAPTRIGPIPIDADNAPTASRVLPRCGHLPAFVDAHLWRVGSASGVTTIRTHRIAGRRWTTLDDAAHDHLRVTEIAFRNGFNSSAHFSKSFRAKFGISPRECRAGRKHGI